MVRVWVTFALANSYPSREADKRHMTNLSAQIITTLDEQEKDLRDNPHVKLKRIPTLVGKDERVIVGTDKLPPPDQQDLDLN